MKAMMDNGFVFVTVLLFLAPSNVQCQVSQMPPTMSPARVAEIRTKYSGGAIVRDMDHIKHDLQQVIQLSSDGTFTAEESIFYLMRMHDFDDNNQLDGLEMMRAFNHAHDVPGQHGEEHGDHSDPPLDTLIQLVDDSMKHDTNQDGFLSFAEWVQGYKSGA